MVYFFGNEPMTVDVKGRVGIPAKFMTLLREHYPDHANQIGYFVTPEGSLKLMPIPVFDQECAKWEQFDESIEDHRIALMFFTSTSDRVTLDGQNRIKLSSTIKRLCGIDRQVIISGGKDSMQLYDEGAYFRMMENRDKVSNALLSLRREQ